MRLTLFRQGVRLVSLPLLFQLGLIALALELVRRQSRAADRVAHAKEVRGVAQNVLTTLVDAETSVRGFLPRRPGVIVVGEAPEDGSLRTVYVRDNGRGILEGSRHKVFVAFQRLHPDAAPGEGMGLAIVARIVERHHGKVRVESVEGQGTTFFVSLPAAPAETGADLPREHAHAR
jgi:light-regulated signal transduction histidine kinase (bacteriophytochrome)